MAEVNNEKLGLKSENDFKIEKGSNSGYSIIYPIKEDKFLEENSTGLCYICQKEISGKDIKKHLMTSCFNKLRGQKESFLMKASAGPYWIYFTIPKEQILSEMYLPLKHLWPVWYEKMSSWEMKYFKNIPSTGNEKNSEAGELEIENKEELAIEFISEIKTSSEKMLILAKNKTPLVEKP